MSFLVALLAGLGTGCGLLLFAMGVVGVEEKELSKVGVDDSFNVVERIRGIDRLRLRMGLAVTGAIIMIFLAPWPVAIFLAAVGGFVSPTIAGAAGRRKEAVARSEAIATWAEQLRDTIGSASGLQESITVTARVAPKEIRAEVQEVASGMRRENLSVLLRRFAVKVDDPAADQVAIALIMASERRGQNLTSLLSDVAAAAREEATMRMRTETSRAQTYSDAKAVTSIVFGVFLLLLLVNRGYLSPFDSFVGQVVMAVVGAMWALAIYGIAELSKVRRPPRILSFEEVDA